MFNISSALWIKEKSRRNVVGDAGVDNLATRYLNRSFFLKGHKAYCYNRGCHVYGCICKQSTLCYFMVNFNLIKRLHKSEKVMIRNQMSWHNPISLQILEGANLAAIMSKILFAKSFINASQIDCELVSSSHFYKIQCLHVNFGSMFIK